MSSTSAHISSIAVVQAVNLLNVQSREFCVACTCDGGIQWSHHWLGAVNTETLQILHSVAVSLHRYVPLFSLPNLNEIGFQIKVFELA